jgi:hypothetical protein
MDIFTPPCISSTPNHPHMNQTPCYLLLLICPLADIAQDTGSWSRGRIKKGKRHDARDFCYALGLDVDGHFFDV